MGDGKHGRKGLDCFSVGITDGTSSAALALQTSFLYPIKPEKGSIGRLTMVSGPYSIQFACMLREGPRALHPQTAQEPALAGSDFGQELWWLPTPSTKM